MCLRTRHYLDDITIFEEGIEGTDFTIYTSSYRMISDVRMNRIGKINRCRFLRQFKYISPRREDKYCRQGDFFTKHRSLLSEECIHRHLKQVFVFLLFFHGITMDLVEDMSRCPLFRVLIHLTSPDLYLDWLLVSLKSQYRGMETLVSV